MTANGQRTSHVDECMARLPPQLVVLLRWSWRSPMNQQVRAFVVKFVLDFVMCVESRHHPHTRASSRVVRDSRHNAQGCACGCRGV